MDKTPIIFGVNYFLKNDKGKYMNEIRDKAMWLKWMELRVNKEMDAIKTPIGYIPKYEDLKRLFKQFLDKDYKEEEYVEQFSLKVPENIRKIDRIIEIYKTKVPNTPKILFDLLEEQKQRLENIRKEHGDLVSPDKF